MPRHAEALTQTPHQPAVDPTQQDPWTEGDWSHDQWPQPVHDPYARPSYARPPARVTAPTSHPPRFKRRYDAATYDVPTFNPVRELINTLGEWTVMLIVVGVVALSIRVFVFEMFNVPSGSMLNTIQIGETIVANKIAYNFESPGRGDVVVFNSPPEELEYDPSSPILIKRIVGLPGETISAVDGEIFVDDQRLEEPYIYPGDITEDFDGITLGEDEYFMMGDHREDSRDSRFFGPIEREGFIGKTIFTAWPIWNFRIFW